MNIARISRAIILAGLLTFTTYSAEASLWPGLGTTANEKSGAFRTDDFQKDTAVLQSPWLIAHWNNEIYAGKVNAAIGREKNKFLNQLSEKNAQRK